MLRRALATYHRCYRCGTRWVPPLWSLRAFTHAVVYWYVLSVGCGKVARGGGGDTESDEDKDKDEEIYGNEAPSQDSPRTPIVVESISAAGGSADDLNKAFGGMSISPMRQMVLPKSFIETTT